MMKIAVLTGAGVSAESGIKTFRDSNGLWENHDIMEVASPQGFAKNPELVLDFYNKRRKQLKEVDPNPAHHAIADLEQEHEVVVITQNVDDLHERAGSSKVIHLHGELKKVRSTFDEDLIFDWEDDLNIGDFCEHNQQLRPHIVWFGEMVPMMEVAMQEVASCEALVIVGTSMQVYPAAGLKEFAPPHAPIYFVDPNPSIYPSQRIKVFAENASTGVPKVVEQLK
ncbi:SIR2 family NAD-dependent protein deacylase [Luteirhabdus pelagi]|uniref:SIR2 family NAD-dependent protein deacylase n=1 Tax=Luteirhabdus pelagi TaxID=2792783 RepID=UPI00193ADA94|nr:NAD-dependent deacylase [Luteirhabdus pelagi]